MPKFGNSYPTQSVNLDIADSLYNEAVELYQKTGNICYEWQSNLLQCIMAVDSDNLWAHQKYGFAIPRRNGKTEIIYILELWGLHKGLSMLHTAHRISTSHASFESVKRYLEKMGYVDGEDFVSIKAKGQERIEFLATGSVLQFRTRTTTGGLGEGFDLLIIDEAQEYTTAQESALKYTVTDSSNPLTVMCGTPPTTVSNGTVFTDYRTKVLTGTLKYSGWAEWSVDAMADVHDVDAWYYTNPSLGYHLTERKIEAELGTDELDHNIQRLGYWASFNQKSVISEKEWKALQITDIPNFKGKLNVGIKYSLHTNRVSVAICVKTDEDKNFVEVVDCQSVKNGTDWIVNFLQLTDYDKVVIDGASGQQLLAEAMKQAGLKKPILPRVNDVILAGSQWEQSIAQKTICHAGQPSLKEVVTNCDKRPIGSSGGFGYKSLYEDRDISLLDSVLLANWLCNERQGKRKQRVFY